jgi:hypothetical protein
MRCCKKKRERLIREINQETWNKCVSSIGHDGQGAQNTAFEIMKHLNYLERDKISVNNTGGIMAFPTLTNNSENWTINRND